MKSTITGGLLGLGTGGSGAIEILNDHKESIQHKTGSQVTIKSVLVNDLTKPRELPGETTQPTDRYEDITRDPEIDVVVEVMGGIDHTLSILLEAIEHGKHIVTANKDLMAQDGQSCLLRVRRLAAIFIMKPVLQAVFRLSVPLLTAFLDRIRKMMGIVNGTTNYIMTKRLGWNRFDSVLKEAQELGFAEADPTADVDGLDAARKMTILSILGFSMPFNLEDVEVKGIRGLSLSDIKYAEESDIPLN